MSILKMYLNEVQQSVRAYQNYIRRHFHCKKVLLNNDFVEKNLTV